MPNPKLETYKSKKTGVIYDYTDADAQSQLTEINGKIPSGASSSNKMATASDVASRVDWSSYAKTGVYNSLNIDGYSLTANGTTVTNITGGKNIKVSNTAWQYAGADFIIANPYKGEHQIFDCDVDYVAGTVGIVIMTNSSASASGATTIATSGYFTEDKHVTLEFDGGSANYFIIRFILNGSDAGAGEINVTNLMISPKSGAYVPYAMTNRELTKAVAPVPFLDMSKTVYSSGTYKDLNDIKTSGMYSVFMSALNKPSDITGSLNNATLIVTANSANASVTQTLIDGDHKAIYVRFTSDGSSWGAWSKFTGTPIS